MIGWLLLVSLVVLGLALALAIYGTRWAAPLLAVVGILGLIMSSAALVRNQNTREFVTKYRAAQETVERARASGRWMESAAVQIKIIELNQELAEKQVWAERSPLPEWLAPVAPILELTPIE